MDRVLTATVGPLLLTVREAAALLSIGRSTLYELIAEREIEVVHIGRSVRVPQASLHAFVARRRVSGGAEEQRAASRSAPHD